MRSAGQAKHVSSCLTAYSFLALNASDSYLIALSVIHSSTFWFFGLFAAHMDTNTHSAID